MVVFILEFVHSRDNSITTNPQPMNAGKRVIELKFGRRRWRGHIPFASSVHKMCARSKRPLQI